MLSTQLRRRQRRRCLQPCQNQKTIEPEPARSATGAPTVLDIKAIVDGSDWVRITSGGIIWTHKEYDWPTAVQVNGVRWNPRLKTLLPSTGQLRFLRTADFSTANITQKTGRGTVTM